MCDEMAFHLSTIVLVCALFLDMHSKALDVKEVESISHIETCPEGQLQITEAYFYHQNLNYPCGVNCTRVSDEDPPSRCFIDPSEEICRPRFSLQDLNRIYKAVDTGIRALDNISVDFERLGKYMIHYACINVHGNMSADPCRDYLQGAIPDRKYTSIIMFPVWSSNSQVRTCQTVCRLQPAGPLQLASNFLLKDDASTEGIFLEYMVSFTNGNQTAWIRINSSYFSEDDNFYFDVREIRIRFNFTDVSAITRLWLYLQGTEFILSCKADSEPSVTTTTEATPTESTRIHSGLEDPEVSGDSHVLLFVIPVVAVVGVGGLAVFFIVKRRRTRQAFPKPEIQPDSSPQSNCNYTNAYEVVNPELETHTSPCHDVTSAARNPGGSDVKVYGTLQHHREQRSAARCGSADTYDHAMLHAHEEPYHRLNRTPLCRGVVDNVYDRAGTEIQS